MQTIDMTPSWTEAARMICTVVENGTDKGRALVQDEILRMGQLIDRLQAKPQVDWWSGDGLKRSNASVSFTVANVRYLAVQDFTAVRLLKVIGENDGVLMGERV